MTEWKEYKLGELLQTKGYVRGPFGSALKRGELLDDGIPVYEQQHAIYNRRVFRFFISEAKYEEMKRFMVQTNDIIISCSGTIGEVSIIKENDPKGIISQALLLLRVNPELVLPNYLLFFLKSKKGHDAIVSCSSGSVQVNIAKREVIESIPLLLPSIAEQNKIVAILSSLDDKIDLLRRENATLEAMAETLFRQWFVEEEKDDWWERMLGDFFDVKTGKRDANYSVENGSFPFFTCSKQTLSAPSYSFEGSAILLAGNGDFNVKRYVGKFEAYQRTYVLIPYEVKYFNLLYIVIKYYLDEITGGHRGSVISFITKGMITDFTVRFPMEDIDNKLKQFDVIFERVDANINQIQTLIQTRDGLLPKLMNNEIKVE